MQAVAIVGVGLIGGSFALALRKAGFEGAILGVSSEPSLQAARKLGVISKAATLEEAAEQADLIYLAQPVAQILKTIQKLGGLPLRKECLMTDAGSTKVEILRTAQHLFPLGKFLGGHPLAGKEQRGVEHADPDLFRNRPYIITPLGNLNGYSVLFEWLERIGANVVVMDAEEHDSTVAFTSHLPQLLSTALAATLSKVGEPQIRQIFGSGLLDMTRLAMSSPDIWMSIIESNKTAVLNALAAFSEVLSELQNRVGSDSLREMFESGAEFARVLRNEPKCTPQEGTKTSNR